MTPDELRDLLRTLYTQTDEKLREQYRRSLSLQDGLLDRWERARRLGFSDDASIYNSALVYGDVKVGEKTWIGPYVLLDGSAGALTIGSYCTVSCGVQIYTHDTLAWALSGGVAKPSVGAVTIGDRCYIGSQAIVARGVTIGDQCVIAAGSFVSKSVAARTIVGGTPATPIGVVECKGPEIALVYNSGRRVTLVS